MRDLRAELNKQNTNIEHSYSVPSKLPHEMVYADDSDFPNEDTHRDNEVQRVAGSILSDHSLKVNDDKWEKTKIERSSKKEDEEAWRNTKKLGSLLGDYQDMKRRVQLANTVMQEVNKIWPMKKLTITQKLKIYRTVVKSV